MESGDISVAADLHSHERLKFLRERKAIRQADFAQRLDVTQPTVSHWESGTTVPSKAMRARILTILGADPYSCETCGR